MKPAAWSFTALEDFLNCPRSYYEKRVAKSVKDEGSAATIWGTYVHQCFEDFIAKGTPIPEDLKAHQAFMDGLKALPGAKVTEQKVALARSLQPCTFFDADAWWRGVIDFHTINGRTAQIVDYKTGKPKPKKDQLMLFALWIFARYPDVHVVTTRYYWTQTLSCTSAVYTRDMVREMWAHFAPSLKQYVTAFKTDTWQPRQSGLCNGWCPVTTCEFWKPRRR